MPGKEADKHGAIKLAKEEKAWRKKAISNYIIYFYQKYLTISRLFSSHNFIPHFLL